MTITLWLSMRGVLDLELGGVPQVELVEDDYRNTLYLPSIPRISLVFSLCSALFACYRMNIPLPYKDYSKEHLLLRWKSIFFQSLGHTPYFVCSVLFRTMSYAFMWTYFHTYSAIPMLLIFISNVASGYHVADKKQIKDKIKLVEAEVKHLYKTCEEEYKEVQYNPAVWMSSFVGMFIPCGYIERMDDYQVITIENLELQFRRGELNEAVEHLEKTFDDEVNRLNRSVNEFRAKHPQTTDEDKKRFNDQVAKKFKNYKGVLREMAKGYGWEYKKTKEDEFFKDDSKTFKEREDFLKETIKAEFTKIRERPSVLYFLDKVHQELRQDLIKGQDVVALSICLFSVGLGMILVNHTKWGYPSNVINNVNFNIYCIVLIVLGALCLVFITFKFDILALFRLDHKDTKHRGSQKVKPEEANSRRTTILRLLVVLCSFLIVIAPLVIGYKMSQGSGKEQFLVIGSDRAAKENKLEVAMFKMHPVNHRAEDLILTNATTIVGWTESIPDTGPIVVVVDEKDFEACAKKMKDIKDSHILVLLENWDYRSSSPFPRKDENDKDIQDFNGDKAPLFSIRKADVKEVLKVTKEKSKSTVKILQNIEDVFEDKKGGQHADADFFSVSCDRPECLDLRVMKSGSCLSNDSESFFLSSLSDGVAWRNIEVTLTCRDNGKECREMKRYKMRLEKELKEETDGCKKSFIPIPLEEKAKMVGLKCSTREGREADLEYWNWFQSKDRSWFDQDNHKWVEEGNTGKCKVVKDGGFGISGNRCFKTNTGKGCSEWDIIKDEFLNP